MQLVRETARGHEVVREVVAEVASYEEAEAWVAEHEPEANEYGDGWSTEDGGYEWYVV